jgi:hypothetical protein
LKESVFYYWQRVDTNARLDTSTERAPGFTQLHLSSATAPLTLHLPQGLTIGLSGLEPDQLSVLLLELDASYAKAKIINRQDA